MAGGRLQNGSSAGPGLVVLIVLCLQRRSNQIADGHIILDH